MSEKLKITGENEKPKRKINKKAAAKWIIKRIQESHFGDLKEKKSRAKALFYKIYEKKYSINNDEKREINSIVNTTLQREVLKNTLHVRRENLQREIEKKIEWKEQLKKLNLNEKDIMRIAQRIPNEISSSSPEDQDGYNLAGFELDFRVFEEVLKALKLSDEGDYERGNWGPMRGPHGITLNTYPSGTEKLMRKNGKNWECYINLTATHKENLIRQAIESYKSKKPNKGSGE